MAAASGLEKKSGISSVERKVSSADEVATLREVLLDRSASIPVRTRAAFWLREQQEDPDARRALRAGLQLRGDSCLLRHELAYILGQLGHPDAVEDLMAIVADVDDDAIVRHEAAEALGAIGDARAKPTLEAHVDDSAPEVRETCRLALDLFAWRDASSRRANAYRSVDPAPPAADATSLEQLRHTLLESTSSLWDRYRAMFRLRDLASLPAVEILAEAVALPPDKLESDLLRHELAFVLGQLAHEAAAPALKAVLRDVTMHPMVRHEAAEALGAMRPETGTDVLAAFASDRCAVVAESCAVALDAMAYYTQEC